MKRLRNGFLCAIVVLLPIFLFISCGEKTQERKIAQETTNEAIPGDFPETGPVSVKKYDVRPGADPSVPADQGGKGFSGEGWETSTTFKSYADPEAKKGGVLTLVMGEYPNTFRVMGKESNTAFLYLLDFGLVYETMLGFDAESMEYKPGLATHWKISEDKKTFWYRIDPDARFSNGNPVTAYDVVASWKIRLDEGIESPSDNMTYGKYEFSAESKYIVKVIVKADDWKLFIWASNSLTVFPASHLEKIDGKGYLEKYQFSMLPGTGPYILDGTKTQKGTQVVLRRRSDYWAANKERNKGYYNFDELKWIVIRDDNLIMEKFKKGEFDVYDVNIAQRWVKEFDLNDESFDALHRGLIQKRKCFNFEPKGLSGIAFNMRKPPYDDIRVRKAFAYLWNVEQLSEKLFYNEYIKLRSTYPGSVYENPDNLHYDYEPKKADSLLNAAGWNKRNKEGIRINSKGEVFEVDMPISQTLERILTPLQQDLKEAGIKLNFNITDGNTEWNMSNERRFKIIYQQWGALFFPNPETSLHSSLADQNSTNNVTGLKDSRIDELIEVYNGEYNAKNRVNHIREIDKILAETVYYAYGYYAPYASRIAFWNKFGMPENVITYTGSDTDPVIALWWYDPDKFEKLEQAKNDKSIKLPIGKTDVDYWGVSK